MVEGSKPVPAALGAELATSHTAHFHYSLANNWSSKTLNHDTYVVAQSRHPFDQQVFISWRGLGQNV
eukprot:6465601-Amphidinium_carterae.1